MESQDFLDHDRALTEANRINLFKNKNLLYWYENLYKTQFLGVVEPGSQVILEIGSGTSPLQHFYKNVLTSDVLDLPYLDHRLDCYLIDQYEFITDGSVDIVSMTNVLHHLRDPIICLKKIAVKLKRGGSVILAEPYFSFLSEAVYKYLHHEPFRFDIESPILHEVKGPLSSANMAIPQMIFLSDKGWDRTLKDVYDFSKDRAIYYSALSYMATGGISRRISIPGWLYKKMFVLDCYLAKKLPGLLSSFFIIRLVKK